MQHPFDRFRRRATHRWLSLSLLLALPLALHAQLPKIARTFKTPAVTIAQGAFTVSVLTARKVYSQSLDAALKGAMASNNLAEANAINSVKSALDAGNEPPPAVFKSNPATQAKSIYDAATTRARSQYATVLQGAQKTVLAAGNLTEANSIQDELKEIGNTPAVAAAPMVGGATIDAADLFVSGKNFTAVTLNDGVQSWGNRAYKWANVPPELQGALYTRTNGGETAEITVKAKRDTVVRVIIDIKDSKFDRLPGWDKTKTHFTSSGNNADLCVFERKLTAGKELKVPQITWCGTLVVVPAK